MTHTMTAPRSPRPRRVRRAGDLPDRDVLAVLSEGAPRAALGRRPVQRPRRSRPAGDQGAQPRVSAPRPSARRRREPRGFNRHSSLDRWAAPRRSRARRARGGSACLAVGGARRHGAEPVRRGVPLGRPRQLAAGAGRDVRGDSRRHPTAGSRGRIRKNVLGALRGADVGLHGWPAAWARLRRQLDALDLVAPADAFWCGTPSPTVADLGLFAQLQSLRTPLTQRQKVWVEERPRLTAWLDRVEAATRSDAT